MSQTGAYLLETLLTLLAVAGVAVAVLAGARRLGVGAPSGPVELVGRLPLDGRRVVYLVRVGGSVLVVGASEAGLVKLGELSEGELRGAPAAPDEPFARVLRKVLGGARPPREAPAQAPGNDA